jgi:hypothetical protein
MFKVTETKTVAFEFEVNQNDFNVLDVAGDKDEVGAHLVSFDFANGTPIEMAKQLRQFADAILKVVSKLEGIK